MKKTILLCMLVFTAICGNAQITSLVENFDVCDSTVQGFCPPGWYVYSVQGTQYWRSFSAFGTSNSPCQEVNGYQGGANYANQDWLITPKLNLSSYTAPMFNFWALWKFAGDSLHIMVSNNYTGTGSPTASGVTWTELTHPQSMFDDTGAVLKHFSCNLTPFKATPMFVAFKYLSTVSDGSRWTVDSVYTSGSSTSEVPVIVDNKISLKIFGQSSENQIRLGFETLGGLYNIYVTDLFGRIVYQNSIETKTGEQLYSIENLNLKKGLYIIKMANENSFGVIKTIVE